MGQNRHPVIRVFDCHVAQPAAGGGLEFLLLHRAPGRIYAGDWRMVGGKLEGKTAWQACIRELQEETGLVPSRLFTVPFLNRFYEWSHDRVNEIPVFLALTSEQTRLLTGNMTTSPGCPLPRQPDGSPGPGSGAELDAAATLYADERLWPR